MKETARGLLLKALATSQVAMAVHEIKIAGYSENCLASRLPELAKQGLVVGTIRPGKKFKEWRLAPAQQTLTLEIPS